MKFQIIVCLAFVATAASTILPPLDLLQILPAGDVDEARALVRQMKDQDIVPNNSGDWELTLVSAECEFWSSANALFRKSSRQFYRELKDSDNLAFVKEVTIKFKSLLKATATFKKCCKQRENVLVNQGREVVTNFNDLLLLIVDDFFTVFRPQNAGLPSVDDIDDVVLLTRPGVSPATVKGTTAAILGISSILNRAIGFVDSLALSVIKASLPQIYNRAARGFKSARKSQGRCQRQEWKALLKKAGSLERNLQRQIMSTVDDLAADIRRDLQRSNGLVVSLLDDYACEVLLLDC